MAVLVEAITVVVRRDAIDRSYEGGWEAFVAEPPGVPSCTDGELVSSIFLSPGEAKAYVDALCGRGLVFISEEQCVDIAVVDQQRGPMFPCDWLECAQLNINEDGDKVRACWLFEDERAGWGVHMPADGIQLVTPPGWTFEHSISKDFQFVPDPIAGT